MENNIGKTVAGTDIAEVKRQNANSGLSYTEVSQLLVEKLSSENISREDVTIHQTTKEGTM